MAAAVAALAHAHSQAGGSFKKQKTITQQEARKLALEMRASGGDWREGEDADAEVEHYAKHENAFAVDTSLIYVPEYARHRSILANSTGEAKLCARIQRRWYSKTIKRVDEDGERVPIRLHRKNLVDRLLFEEELINGLFRFVNQTLIFCLMVTAALMGSAPSVKRGIYNNLIDSFQLTSLQEIKSRPEFMAALPSIADASKRYFLLSSNYFASGGQGYVEKVPKVKLSFSHGMGKEHQPVTKCPLYQPYAVCPEECNDIYSSNNKLHGPLQKFDSPTMLGGLDVSIQAPEVSFTTWVKISGVFSKGYIFRKRLDAAGFGSDLSCWALFLNRDNGPELRYGVHDVFPTDMDTNGPSGREVRVALSKPVHVEHETFMLLTAIITENSITFWRDLEKLGTEALRRPVTDCYNDGEGILIGDSGLSLGQLRFHPRSLTKADIEELYQYGNRLSDMSTGSGPFVAEQTPLNDMTKSIKATTTALGDAVKKRQQEFEVTLEAQDVGVQVRAGVGYASNPMSNGDTAASSSTTPDAVTGRDYYQLIGGPVRLSTTSDADARYLTNVPSFRNSGMTLSFWYRHVNCPVQTCGVYLIHAFDDNYNTNWACWTLWIENDAIWTDGHANKGYIYFADLDVEDKYKPKDDIVWRHIAYQFDEVKNVTRFFLDGAMVYEKKYGKPVVQADCAGPNTKWSLGHMHPGYQYGREVEVADMRMYHHSQPNPAGKLTSAQILQLATGDTTSIPISADHRCLPISDSRMADSTWKNSYGHGCVWYYQNAKEHPKLCLSEEARRQCPISCQSRQECFVRESEQDVAQFAWDRTRLIQMKGPNGTICLGSHLTKKEVVEECQRWVSSDEMGAKVGRGTSPADDEYLEGWLDSISGSHGPRKVSQPRSGRRINLTLCEELEISIEEHCSFNIDSVRTFTSKMRENGGDFTVSFWVKPVGVLSNMGTSGSFFPHINFLSTISPPQHNLLFGMWVNPNGESRIHSKCRPASARDSYFNIEIEKASDSEWTFFAITYRNISSMQGTFEGATFTDLGKNSELAAFPVCLFDESALFSAIEINYPVLISPIMMLPRALPTAKVNEEYLKRVEEMAIRSGPITGNDERVKTTIPVEKQDFDPISTLTASPIIFQTRVQPTSDCPYAYSSSWVARQHEKAVESRCKMPFQCENEVISNVFSVMSCPGSVQDQGSVFGLSPASFLGATGYADFLYSITDNEYVFRNDSRGQGELRDTGGFVDALTQSVNLIFVFFTPREGLTSVLNVLADFSGAVGAEVSFEVLHFGIIEGSRLTWYLIVQSLVLFNVALLCFEAVLAIRRNAENARRLQISVSIGRHVEPMVDIFCGLAVIVYVAMRFPAQINSAKVTRNILGTLDEIPWDSAEVQLREKKQIFFDTVAELLGKIDEIKMQDTLCNIILLINLLRVIQCTKMHPRLALLTGTLTNAMDDLWHTAILTCLLMLCFAMIGTWRFGSEYDIYGSFETSLQTEFELLFGEFQDGWADNRDMAAFNVIYLMTIFLLVLNFLLAIIVEAYMELRKEIEDKETEQNFFLDVRDVFLVKYLSFRHRWPKASFLASEIAAWEAKLSVGFLDLYDTHMFVDLRSTGSFLKFYARFDFLEPIHVSKFGISPELQALWSSRVGASSGDSFGHQIVRVGAHLEQLIDMAVRARDKPRSQRQDIQDAIEIVDQRRKARAKGNVKEASAVSLEKAALLQSSLSDIRKRLSLDEVEDVHGQVHEALDWHDQMHSLNMEMIREALDALITVIHKSDERHEQYYRKQEEGAKILARLKPYTYAPRLTI